MKRNVADGKHQDDSLGVIHAADLSNEAVIDAFIAAMRGARLSQVTIDNRGWLLSRLADDLPVPLTQAEYRHLQDWQNSLVALSPGTIAGYVASVRVFYRWLVRPMRVLTVSPADDLVIPRVPDHKPRPIPETDFQYSLLGCADIVTKVWLELGRYAGLRCMEIASLTRDRVLNDPPRLHIVGKGRRERIVFISPELREDLAQFMSRQGHLFLGPLGKPYRAKTVSDRINDHFRGMGMPYTAHQLRHTYGSDALHRTKNLRLVQSQMGHRSPATTQVYTEVDEPEAIALATDLGADLRAKTRRR